MPRSQPAVDRSHVVDQLAAVLTSGIELSIESRCRIEGAIVALRMLDGGSADEVLAALGSSSARLPVN